MDEEHITICFVCTHNHFRSPFAERLFNHQAALRQLRWRATSRGLDVVDNGRGLKSIAPVTVQALKRQGVDIAKQREHSRRALTMTDFDQASIVICMSEREHLPMMRHQFPRHLPSTTFWNVDDGSDGETDDDHLVRLQRVATQVMHLLDQLQEVEDEVKHGPIDEVKHDPIDDVKHDPVDEVKQQLAQPNVTAVGEKEQITQLYLDLGLPAPVWTSVDVLPPPQASRDEPNRNAMAMQLDKCALMPQSFQLDEPDDSKDEAPGAHSWCLPCLSQWFVSRH